MKKHVLMTAVMFAMVSPSAMAHHPAADVVPEDIYAAIDENLADTPHADMTFDDMGGAMEAREDMGADAVSEGRMGMDDGAYMEANADAGDSSYSESRQESGDAANADDNVGGVGSQLDDDDAVDTFGLMEDVVSTLAE